jgi:hypothetical protein
MTDFSDFATSSTDTVFSRSLFYFADVVQIENLTKERDLYAAKYAEAKQDLSNSASRLEELVCCAPQL